MVFAMTARADVSVRVALPGVHYRTFDPAKPPAEMPPLASREGAVTACSFGFSAEPHYDVITRWRGADGNWTATIAVTGVSVYVRLTVIVWTPKGVSAKLKAHEEGHRTLDEMMYKKLAEPAARAAGAEMDGYQFTGQGTTAAKAEADALRTMFKQAGHDYLAQCSDLNDQVNAAYDTLTRHGTSPISEADAIKQAVEQFERDHKADAQSK
jgi:hypothetical protein